MLPSVEEDLANEYHGSVLSAREASCAVRDEARDLYLEMVAAIGTAPLKKDCTFRQALSPRGEASRWWYHPVAFKDCESSPTFNQIIAILTIGSVARSNGVEKLILRGAPPEVAAVLKTGFQVQESAQKRGKSWYVRLRRLASRLRNGWLLLTNYFMVRGLELPEGPFEVAFFGFWDWSVWKDKQTGAFTDRFFKTLPQELRGQGVASVGWFAWFDPQGEPNRRHRPIREALTGLQDQRDVALLQGFLRPRDILQAMVDFRPLMTYLQACRKNAFQKLFQRQGLNFASLFAEPLLLGFIDASLPTCSLMALATSRAALRYRPKAALSFLEHYTYARAFYEGVHRTSPGTVKFTVQHASCAPEKTFLFLHPTLEFQGQPEGCAVPHPDYACVMGALGYRLFSECGYPPGKVLLTGSPRYEHVRISSSPSQPPGFSPADRQDRDLRVLLIPSLDAVSELEMVDAAWAASRDVDGVRLYLRNHPFSRLDDLPEFSRYRDRIELTQGTLEENLDAADLILFTYSTVAEEALLRGKPVWQWLTLGYNGSALAAINGAPQFRSVAGFRRGLQEFLANGNAFLPSEEKRREVFQDLFSRGEDVNSASKQISAIIKLML
jgi:surface carbohydrate biosynthesis protein (TIGR04326 family)